MVVRGGSNCYCESISGACAFEKKPGRRELAFLALLSPHRSLSFLTLPVSAPLQPQFLLLSGKRGSEVTELLPRLLLESYVSHKGHQIVSLRKAETAFGAPLAFLCPLRHVLSLPSLADTLVSCSL